MGECLYRPFFFYLGASSRCLNPQKLALISPTSGGRSVGVVRSRTQAMELFRSRRVIIFHTLCRLTPRKEPRYPLDRRPDSRPEYCGEEKIFHCQETNPGRTTQRHTDVSKKRILPIEEYSGPAKSNYLLIRVRLRR
jgi:hypothetical protein